MQQPGDQLLARAALAPHDDADLARRHAPHALDHLPHHLGVGDDLRPIEPVHQVVLESSVLLLQPLAMCFEALDLPHALEGDAGQRGHRAEKAPVIAGEAAGPAAPRLLVAHRHVTQIDLSPGQRHGQQLAVLPPGQFTVAPDQRLPAGDQLTPHRPRQQLLPRGRIARPADTGGGARLAQGVSRDRHRRCRVEGGAHPLQQLVHQLLLGPVGVQGHGQVVQRLELQDAQLLGQLEAAVRHRPAILPRHSVAVEPARRHGDRDRVCPARLSQPGRYLPAVRRWCRPPVSRMRSSAVWPPYLATILSS